MKTLHKAAVLILFELVILPLRVCAIQGLNILVVCPDVVLSWPSQAGETYIVQYRLDRMKLSSTLWHWQFSGQSGWQTWT